LDNRETKVILGGTSTIAKNVAKIWLKQRPIKIILIGRNSQKLQAVFSELNNINPLSEINCAELKFDDIDARRKLIHEIVKSKNVSKDLLHSVPYQIS
jgi:Short-chain dehydrogenases of various substrate specificities